MYPPQHGWWAVLAFLAIIAPKLDRLEQSLEKVKTDYFSTGVEFSRVLESCVPFLLFCLFAFFALLSHTL